MKNIFKKIYQLIPFKKYIFLGVKKLVNLPESIYKHLHFHGVITINAGDAHQFKMYHHGTSEENELFWGGIENGWERTSLKLWRKLCIDAETVFDVGANTGLYSLITKSLNQKAQVVAFEPVPKVLEYLNYNIEINHYDIKIEPKAASNFNGEAKVYLIKGVEFTTSVTVNKSLLAETTPKDELIIKTIRLDTFIEENKIDKIDLMKIDVETHEPEVLEGMGEYLDKFKPDFLIEVWDKECAATLNHLFKNKGYLYFDLDDKNDVITQKNEITVSSFWNYLICKPETAKKIGLI
ncbi:MAG: FkbM family methyltransferase [Flavobacteriales bacterium]|nr:FkbM family methyltransferase [Flavobacteriales bacterium]MCW8912405.1 FkbM family methyltransferase [Flavobacteriales bacterium]MCW8936489.1 FkbM family methyltransferase [Flavobacteriales bacterium]MCW8939951.1 FkbM family methyltransferase [Flavobacteriales bacterium]MCW8969193.1 FkbM family methyltransferase [Flavobacteriales bacterium]